MNKNIIFIILAVFFSRTCLAQNSVEFNYDENGNRILRQITVSKNNERDATDSPISAPATEVFQLLSVTLYPNPTEGNFTIAVNNATDEAVTLRAILSTISGAVIYDKTFTSKVENFDLTKEPNGIYLLRLIAGNENRVWKVIKK